MLDRIKQEAMQGKALLSFVALKATGQALAMVAPLVIAKFFSPGLFGSYSLAKMLIFFFVSLFISSIQVPFVVYGGRERAATGKINRTFTVQCVFVAVSLVLFLLMVLAFAKYVMSFAQISKMNLLFLCLAFLGISSESFLSNLFLATGQRTQHSLLEFFFGLCSLLLILGLRLIGWINLNSAFLIYSLSAIIVIFSFIRCVDFKVLLPIVWDREYFRDNFTFTKWVLLGASSVYLVNWGDNIVLRYYVPMDDIGIYNFAYQIFKGMTMLTFVVVHYFMPFASTRIDDKQAIRVYLASKRPKAFLLGLAPICMLFVFAPYLVKTVYGGVYDDSIGILRILLIGCVPALYSGFYTPLLYALERYRFAQCADAAQAVANVLLDLALVWRMGVYGAAVATVIAYCGRTVMFEVYFRKHVAPLFDA